MKVHALTMTELMMLCAIWLKHFKVKYGTYITGQPSAYSRKSNSSNCLCKEREREREEKGKYRNCKGMI